MPEGPEVLIMAERISAALKGAIITDIKIIAGRYGRHGPPARWEEFKATLPLKFDHIKTYGKYLSFHMTSSANAKEVSPAKTGESSAGKVPFVLGNSFGLDGGWTTIRSKNTGVVMKYRSPEGQAGKLYFTDLRNFGQLWVLTQEEHEQKIAKIGPDMLQIALNPDFKPRATATLLPSMKFGWRQLRARLQRYPRRQIVKSLMDQSVVSGIGNYIKAESLYLAGLAPARRVSTITDREFKRLFNAIRKTMKKFYKARGSINYTRKIPWSPEAPKGAGFAVYGKKKDPKGAPVKVSKLTDQRTTYWVPKVQK